MSRKNEVFFVTGATGCIGGWVVKNLVERGYKTFALSRKGNLDNLELIMERDAIDTVGVVAGDIEDFDVMQRCVDENGVTRIIHLAAMQLPFCKADPRRGARVNVEGTVNIFEIAKRAGISSIVYSSSTAVYGTRNEYESDDLGHEAELIPHSHYGVYKQANEWSARVYFESDAISSIGIRPYVVYGPLRDQGMTSTPTTAIKAAVKGESYEISYGGKFNFQYTSDSADAFINAALADHTGADVYNLGGGTVDMVDVVRTIEAVVPAAKGTITYKDISLPFPPNAENDELEKVIGPVCTTPLSDGIARTVEIFRNNLDRI